MYTHRVIDFTKYFTLTIFFFIYFNELKDFLINEILYLLVKIV